MIGDYIIHGQLQHFINLPEMEFLRNAKLLSKSFVLVKMTVHVSLTSELNKLCSLYNSRIRYSICVKNKIKSRLRNHVRLRKKCSENFIDDGIGDMLI